MTAQLYYNKHYQAAQPNRVSTDRRVMERIIKSTFWLFQSRCKPPRTLPPTGGTTAVKGPHHGAKALHGSERGVICGKVKMRKRQELSEGVYRDEICPLPIAQWRQKIKRSVARKLGIIFISFGGGAHTGLRRHWLIY